MNCPSFHAQQWECCLIFLSELLTPQTLSPELPLLCQAGAEQLLCVRLWAELISLLSLEVGFPRGCREEGLGGCTWGCVPGQLHIEAPSVPRLCLVLGVCERSWQRTKAWLVK